MAVNPAEITMFIEPLDLPKRVVFLAINDNSKHTGWGTHWRLLVYLQGKNGFFHSAGAAASALKPRKNQFQTQGQTVPQGACL